MTTRGDEVKVGLVVMGTGAILIATVALMLHYSPFQPHGDEYLVYLKFAGGLESDSIVRFGGMRRGKVTAVRLAPGDKGTVEVVLRVQKGTPVRTDSTAKIAALNALGENYVEISPGNGSSPLLKPGQTIRSEETPEFSELLAKISALSDDARTLIADLDRDVNQISSGAGTLLGNLNEVTGERNRQTLASILDGTNGLISNANSLVARNSPRIDAIAANLQSGTEKIDRLVGRVDEVVARTDTLVQNADGMLTENRPQLKRDLEVLEATLADVRKLMTEVTAVLEANRNDFDTIFAELRRASENLREFTQTIKQRPFSLVRVKPLPDRKVPQ